MRDALRSAVAAATLLSAAPQDAQAQGLTPYDIGGSEHVGSAPKKTEIGDAWSAVSAPQETIRPVLAQDENRLREYLGMREKLKGFHVQFSGKEVSWPQYAEFCNDLAIFCAKFARNLEEPQEADMSPETFARIMEVNTEVTKEVVPENDEKLYGVSEKWTIPGVAGDCEDFVILKMSRLIDADIDPSRLHILVVRQKDGSGHAVLAVDVPVDGRTNTLVLDNLTDAIVPIEEMEKTYQGVYASFLSRREGRELDVHFFEYKKAAQ